jgi:ketosteroid isomerase-like protein
MIRTVALAFVASLLVAVSVVHADPRAEIDAIRALDAKWVRAIAAKDVDWITNVYADDGRLMAPGAPAAEGHDAIGAAWKARLAAPGPALTFEPRQIHLAGTFDHAYEIGTWKLGDLDDGKYVLVWKKHGPEWKVVADIYNSNHPAPATAAPPAP